MPTLSATYKLEIDWNNDGDFGDAGEDVSADWISAEITRGFSDPLARVATVGRATFVLDNSAKAYSPPLVANVTPRRPVKFTMTYSSAVVLFRGYIESIKPTSGPKFDRRVVIECVDSMALLDLHEGAIAAQTNAKAPAIIGAIVSAVFTPASTDYDYGVSQFPISGDTWSDELGLGYFEAAAARKIQDVCVSDWGRFFIKKNGDPAFRDRHSMPTDTTTELTVSNTMRSLSYSRDVGRVYNLVEVTCHPRSVGTINEVLGMLEQGTPPRIEASASQTFVIEFRDPALRASTMGALSVVTPVATTDYLAYDDETGVGTNATGSVTCSMTAFGNRAEITLTNAAAFPVYITYLRVRGIAVRAAEPVTVRATDATSVTAYQRRKLSVDAPLMNTQHQAQRLADYLLAQYKDPQHNVGSVEILANGNATLMAAVRDLELLDRVSITEAQTGLSTYTGHIYAMTHSIRNKFDHALRLDVETAYNIGGTAFRLTTSALNSGHYTIY